MCTEIKKTRLIEKNNPPLYDGWGVKNNRLEVVVVTKQFDSGRCEVYVVEFNYRGMPLPIDIRSGHDNEESAATAHDGHVNRYFGMGYELRRY